MISGRSAGLLDLYGRVVSIVGMVLVLVAGITIAAARPPVAVSIAVAAVVLVILLVGQVLRARATRRARDEAAQGYSTLIDAIGFDFRDSRTGEIIRTRDEQPLGAPNARVYDAIRRRD